MSIRALSVFSVPRRRRSWQVACWVAVGLAVILGLYLPGYAAESGAESKTPAIPVVKDLGPSGVPTVEWLPKQRPVKLAEAREAKEMKPYTEEILGTDVTFDMVPIPGGEFLMGSPKDEADRKEDEGPQREGRGQSFLDGQVRGDLDGVRTLGHGHRPEFCATRRSTRPTLTTTWPTRSRDRACRTAT